MPGSVVPGGVADSSCGMLAAEDVVQQLVEVAAPADRHGGGGDAVLQQQARGDDDGRELAERRVGIGVRRTGHRDRAGHLGVAERGQAGGEAGEQERDDTAGPGVRHGLAAARRRCRCRRWRRRRTSSAGTCRSCARAAARRRRRALRPPAPACTGRAGARGRPGGAIRAACSGGRRPSCPRQVRRTNWRKRRGSRACVQATLRARRGRAVPARCQAAARSRRGRA